LHVLKKINARAAHDGAVRAGASDSVCLHLPLAGRAGPAVDMLILVQVLVS